MLEPLHPEVAQVADGSIDEVLKSAARQVTLTGCPLPDALYEQWQTFADERPFDWAFAVLRLRETGNEEMIHYAHPEEV